MTEEPAGDCVHCGNDHALSWDNRYLAVSHDPSGSFFPISISRIGKQAQCGSLPIRETPFGLYLVERDAQGQGIRPIIMADGPAGLRLSKRYQIKDGEAVSLESSLTLNGQQEQTEAAEESPVYYQYCTAIPIGTAIAQSWDTAAASVCGEIVGEEMERFGIDIWLAPP